MLVVAERKRVVVTLVVKLADVAPIRARAHMRTYAYACAHTHARGAEATA